MSDEYVLYLDDLARDLLAVGIDINDLNMRDVDQEGNVLRENCGWEEGVEEITMVFGECQALAGFEYGESVYDKFVKECVLNSGKDRFKLFFPSHIIMVASSFVQGFFAQEAEKYSIEEIKKRFTICSDNPELEDIIWKRLY